MLRLKGLVIPYPQPWIHMVMPFQTLALLNTEQHTDTDWGKSGKNDFGFPVFAYSLYFTFINIHLTKLLVLETSSPDVWGRVLSLFPFTAISFLSET